MGKDQDLNEYYGLINDEAKTADFFLKLLKTPEDCVKIPSLQLLASRISKMETGMGTAYTYKDNTRPLFDLPRLIEAVWVQVALKVGGRQEISEEAIKTFITHLTPEDLPFIFGEAYKDLVAVVKMYEMKQRESSTPMSEIFKVLKLPDGFEMHYIFEIDSFLIQYLSTAENVSRIRNFAWHHFLETGKVL